MAAANSRGPGAYSQASIMFAEQKAMQIHGGIFTVNNPPPSSRKLLDILSLHVNPKLFHDSKTHDRLLHESRYELCSTIESEIDIVARAAISAAHDGQTRSLRRYFSSLEQSRIIALKTSKLLESRGALLSSIMLPRQPYLTRADGEDQIMYHIIASLVYQIVRKIPSVSRHVSDAIDNDPLIFTRTAEVQIQTLIVEPWIAAAHEDFPERCPLASTVVVNGPWEQIGEGSACVRIFDTIESIAKDRNRESPLVLILISSTPNSHSNSEQLKTLAGILAICHKDSVILVCVLFDLASHFFYILGCLWNITTLDNDYILFDQVFGASDDLNPKGAPGEEFSCVLSWMRNEKGVDSEA
ncbi:hypothetical protein BJ912DRAFT_925347 [Pholiota molesta]|nr:hypothetical protein BJ912DRAFT_925347 [Pholiota molesta]